MNRKIKMEIIMIEFMIICVRSHLKATTERKCVSMREFQIKTQIASFCGP